jgi:cysteinyl-tRNA synthetase
MSIKYLGEPFDIHTGGIDHREIHHPNEIAQNQAYTRSSHTGAAIWMHNNFLIDRSGKLSKSAGGALLLRDLIDRGYHPMAFRLMCLQAHYRSPLEFSFTALGGALSRLKRIVMIIEELRRNAQGALPVVETTIDYEVLERFRGEIGDDHRWLHIPRRPGLPRAALKLGGSRSRQPRRLRQRVSNYVEPQPKRAPSRP